MSMNQNIDVKKLLFIIVPLISIMLGITLLQTYQFERERDIEEFDFQYINAPEGNYIDYIIECDISDKYIDAKNINVTYLNMFLSYLREDTVENPILPYCENVDKIIQKYESTFEIQLFAKMDATFSFYKGLVELERSVLNETGLYRFNFSSNQFDKTFIFSEYDVNCSGYFGGSIVLEDNVIEYDFVDLEFFSETESYGAEVSMTDYVNTNEIRIVATFDECYSLSSKYFEQEKGYAEGIVAYTPSEITNITSQTSITDNEYKDYMIKGIENNLQQYDVSVFTKTNNSDVPYSNNENHRYIDNTKLNLTSKFMENTFNPYRLLNTSYSIQIYDAKPYYSWGYDFTDISINVIPFLIIGSMALGYTYYLTKKKEGF